MAARYPHSSAIKALQKELKELSEIPVEGFDVMVSDADNLLVWDVVIFGPPMTLYESGYFKARLNFPDDYPYSPPSMHFLSKMFHPNIYENGEVCISILHSPGDDPHSGESPAERWNPTQNVRTILLSVISMLNEPNINSAAHVDASVAYRSWVESNGVNNEYENIVKSLVKLTHLDAEKDGVTVPTTLEDYCSRGRAKIKDETCHLSDSDNLLYYDDNEYYGFDIEEDGDDNVGSDTDQNSHRISYIGSAPEGVDSALEEPDIQSFSKQQSKDPISETKHPCPKDNYLSGSQHSSDVHGTDSNNSRSM